MIARVLFGRAAAALAVAALGGCSVGGMCLIDEDDPTCMIARAETETHMMMPLGNADVFLLSIGLQVEDFLDRHRDPRWIEKLERDGFR